MNLTYTYDRDDLNALNYSVMVEMWEHRSFGKARREYTKEFSYRERNILAQYYVRFYNWHLKTGTPESFTFRKIETVHLLKRAINFFGGL